MGLIPNPKKQCLYINQFVALIDEDCSRISARSISPSIPALGFLNRPGIGNFAKVVFVFVLGACFTVLCFWGLCQKMIEKECDYGRSCDLKSEFC